MKALNLFRIFVTLWGLSTTFLDITHFINQSLLSPLEAQDDYTGWKDFF